jgi:hypothetical protein
MAEELGVGKDDTVLVNAVGGVKQVRNLEYGEQLWTLVDGEVKRTSVVDMTSHKVRELVEVRTEKGVVQATPDHPFATPDGWVEAADLIVKGMDGAISTKRVTYDFARLMDGATELATAAFGDEIIKSM